MSAQTDQDLEFREEFRAWLSASLTDDLRDPPTSGPLRRKAAIEWQRKLYEGGWIAPSWPREWGGRDATPSQMAIFHEETALARAPNPANAIGIWNIGPMLLRYGTASQKQRWLPKMLSGEEIWCQGFSEPEAGSDLASLKTKASVSSDGFVINGQKIWTTFADVAARCLALVRTDPSAPKHKGLSAIVIDMHSSGVEVRPIKEITGEEGFNEIFFTDVFAPSENLVGELNKGWETAISTLTHERMGTTTLAIQLRRQLHDLISLARRVGAIRDPLVRDQLMQLHVEVEATHLLAARGLEKLARGEAPTTESAIGKLQWSFLWQRIAELAVEITSPSNEVDNGRWLHALLYSRMTTIGAGTTEIQRNILAQRALGLPR
ncbi:MAG: acyl-CoA dehydrogenase family protein [Actinomycetota bacterium]